ncbi:sulfurtransferase [Polynucleobacter sp. AP-RePozz3-80-G7]|uniref:sulfurtransferase n=1 Tax=Polynucleobacter sp. AP-RePozz3-80-G7 TaxID=2689105 RepID=UPI001C0C1887|nr:rhodanese-like domain-containing protein [Polynucleobacter sp. AP-RePozz3-80-G7]MBU3639054.1 sulfurtransferase [Polynucleobacter sp. AP-RePozz3-80-G7]
MKKIQLLLAFALTGLVSLVQAITLPGPVVSADWLSNNQSDVQIIEVRTDLASYLRNPEFDTDKKTGKKFLVEVGGHITNSTLLDFKKVRVERLVDEKKIKFLIPEKADFEKLVQSLGINSDKPIVLVPIGQDMSDIDEALRTYWSFKVYGEDQVAVLDGGIAGWLGEGREYVTNNAQKVTGNWSAKAYRKELIASSDDVAAASKAGKPQLLDARQPAQYLGLAKRPDVLTFGHIAGSKELAPELLAKPSNGALYFWQKNTYDALMSANGLSVKGPTIAYCNTGHLAAGGWFVMSELVGNKSTKLYDGSLYLWTLEGRPLVGVPLN